MYDPFGQATFLSPYIHFANGIQWLGNNCKPESSLLKALSSRMEFFIGIALLLPISALAIQAYETDFDDDRCDFL